MKDLDHIIAKLRQEPTPSLPLDFNPEVWARIEAKRPSVISPWWAIWQTPRVALTAAAAALTIGIGTATVVDPDTIDRRTALGMDAFSAHAPNLPATLIAEWP